MADAPEPQESQQEESAREARRLARLSLPAVYIDTWGFHSWRGHIRIALGEQAGDTDSYRFAYVMELDDAETFANQVLRVVQRRKERDARLQRRPSNRDGEG